MPPIASTTRLSADSAEASPQSGGTSPGASVIVRRGDGPTREPAESRMNRIARRAHEIYEARNGQHGTAMEDWLTAERQIDEEIDRAQALSNTADAWFGRSSE